MEKSTVLSQNKFPFWKPLTVRNFLLLYIGENVSLLGDQFYIIALPWLTIQLTNSGITLGTVLMAAAIPRAVLMLFGGVFSDRFSPRLVMLVSNALRGVLIALFTIVVAFKLTKLWHLYFFGISFGILDGFFIPASKSIIPTLVPAQYLVAANILSQGTSQLILLIGPALGGLLIAIAGIKIAFAFDGLTFIITTATLLLMKGRIIKSHMLIGESNQNSTSNNKAISLITGMREGFNYGWNNYSLRLILLIVIILNFLFMGPLQVGMTSLAHSRFQGGAVSLGIMQSAWGGGGLIGTLAPQIISNLPRLGILILILASVQGLGLFLLSFVPHIALSSITVAILGFCSSFFTVVGITWIQKQTPSKILGRVMSLVMFSSLGIAPFSYALAGVLVNFNVTILFTVAGSIMLITIAFLALNSSIRQIN